MAALEFSRPTTAPVPPSVAAGSRAEISVSVAAYLSGNLTPVMLQQVTSGGCRLVSPVELAPTSIQQFRFTTQAGQVITLIVRIGSCRSASAPAPSWIVECVFPHAGVPSVQRQIAALIDDVRPGRRVA